jgi:hypothetical protein
MGIKGTNGPARQDVPLKASGTEVSRRQLLRGVAGSAAISLLVTVPPTRAFAAASGTSTATYPASDILWLFGTSNTDDGYIAQAVAPDATQVTRLKGLAYTVGRSADGQHIVSACAGADAPTEVQVFDAASGALAGHFNGGFKWPADPDLLLSVDRTTGSLALVGTAFVSTPTGRVAIKEAPAGGTREVAVLSWKAYQGIEVFDLTGARLSSVAPQEVELGNSLQLAHAGGGLLLIQHGPRQTQVRSAAAATPTKASTWDAGGHTKLKHIDDAGRTYLLTDAGDLLIWAKNGARTVAPLALHSVEKQMARPYPATVLNTSPDTVAVVDASRQFLATVDAGTGRVIARRTLLTSTVFVKAADTSGAAAAVDQARRRIYVLDRSGVAGGVWVHDADTLDVIDRWHSDVMFRLVWVAPSTGTVYLQANEGPVAVHDAGGRLVSFVASDVAAACAL